MHYFRNNDGKIFDLKTKWGAGDYGMSREYKKFNGNYDPSKRYKDSDNLKSPGYFKNDRNRFDYKPGTNYGPVNNQSNKRPPFSDIPQNNGANNIPNNDGSHGGQSYKPSNDGGAILIHNRF